jgi:hypothetical protein
METNPQESRPAAAGPKRQARCGLASSETGEQVKESGVAFYINELKHSKEPTVSRRGPHRSILESLECLAIFLSKKQRNFSTAQAKAPAFAVCLVKRQKLELSLT